MCEKGLNRRARHFLNWFGELKWWEFKCLTLRYISVSFSIVSYLNLLNLVKFCTLIGCLFTVTNFTYLYDITNYCSPFCHTMFPFTWHPFIFISFSLFLQRDTLALCIPCHVSYIISFHGIALILCSYMSCTAVPFHFVPPNVEGCECVR